MKSINQVFLGHFKSHCVTQIYLISTTTATGWNPLEGVAVPPNPLFNILNMHHICLTAVTAVSYCWGSYTWHKNSAWIEEKQSQTHFLTLTISKIYGNLKCCVQGHKVKWPHINRAFLMPSELKWLCCLYFLWICSQGWFYILYKNLN